MIATVKLRPGKLSEAQAAAIHERDRIIIARFKERDMHKLVDLNEALMDINRRLGI